ncbi:MAG: hypothetical protein ACR2HF_16240 [Methylococcaceae bacterium]
MNTLAEPLQAQPCKTYHCRAFSQWLKEQLPKRFKRLIFLSSAMAALRWNQSTDASILKRINAGLSLASNPAALELPALKYRWIWKNPPTLKPDGSETTPDFLVLACSLIQMAPLCIVYGPVEEIALDLRSLYQVVNSLV